MSTDLRISMSFALTRYCLTAGITNMERYQTSSDEYHLLEFKKKIEQEIPNIDEHEKLTKCPFCFAKMQPPGKKENECHDDFSDTPYDVFCKRHNVHLAITYKELIISNGTTETRYNFSSSV